MFLMAHRGIKSLCPENTMASFKMTKEKNIPWIETDVRLSKDNVALIMHDPCFDEKKFPLLKGLEVCQTKFLEIKKIDVGSYFDKKFSDEKILSLEEFLDFIVANKMNLNLEIKGELGKEDTWDNLVNVIYKTLSKYLDKINDFMISSFRFDILKKIRAHNKDIKLGLLVAEDNLCTWEQMSEELDLYSINIHFQALLFLSQFPKKIKNRNLKIFAWTVNDPSLLTKMQELGVDSIISDCPQDFKL